LAVGVIDTLIRDVLPLPSYDTLDDIAYAIIGFKTTIADVLSVEPRQYNTPLWSVYHPNAGIWWSTLWYRINIAQALCKTTAKAEQFIHSHKACIDYLESLPSKGLLDHEIDVNRLQSLYQSASSLHDEDRSLVKMQRVRLQTKPTPLQIICDHYPLDPWTVEQMVSALERGSFVVPDCIWDKVPVRREAAAQYKIFMAAHCICYQCETYCKATSNTVLQDALYFYYLAFLDFFCQTRFDDQYLTTEAVQEGIVTPFEKVYPLDTRAFLADDLPNLYHILVGIPLYGQQSDPSFLIAKVICAHNWLHTIFSHLFSFSKNVSPIADSVVHCWIFPLRSWNTTSHLEPFFSK
jgi:hypothetical protein